MLIHTEEVEVEATHEERDYLGEMNIPKVSKQMIFGGGLIFLALVWMLANRGGEDKPKVTQAFSPKMSEQTVQSAADQEAANFMLASARLQSGLIRGQANQFLGVATQFQNQPGHFCFGKPLSTCLRSFQETREKQILAYKMGEIQSGTKGQYAEIARMVFEINAIEYAIAEAGGNVDAATQQFLDTVMPYPAIKEPPIIEFIEAFGEHRKKKQMMEAANREKLENHLADQKLQECRQTGAEGCF